MMNRVSITSPVAQAARRQSARRVQFSHSAGWGIRRIRRSWFSPPPLPTMEEVEERLRDYRGFFASLTPEQRAFLDAWDGPEISGNLNGPRRTF